MVGFTQRNSVHPERSKTLDPQARQVGRVAIDSRIAAPERRAIENLHLAGASKKLHRKEDPAALPRYVGHVLTSPRTQGIAAEIPLTIEAHAVSRELPHAVPVVEVAAVAIAISVPAPHLRNGRRDLPHPPAA